MGDLGLNEPHQEQLLSFLKFCRAQRIQRLRALDACFQDTEKSRLSDSTYTKDEVKELLSALLDSVRADMQSELLNTAHTSLLLVRQLCGQAEKWQLNLIINLSELQNKELLDAVLLFEEQQFSRKSSTSAPSNTKISAKAAAPSILKRLEPIDYTSISGGDTKLKSEIDRLRQDNEKMRKKLNASDAKNVEQQSAIEQHEQTRSEHAVLQEKLQEVQEKGGDDQETQRLQAKLDGLAAQLQQSNLQQVETKSKLEGELGDTQQRLLDLNAQLRLTEAELEKKFSKTNAYKTMKQLLSSKNKTIKTMRTTIHKYEPDVDNSAEEAD